MRRLFVPAAQLAGERVSLTAEQARHLKVLRLLPGALLEIFDGAGARFRAELLPDGALRVTERLAERHLPGAPEVVLAQALVKGEKLDLVVQKATELGVARIVPLACGRSVVKLDAQRGAARTERLRRIAGEAARQCGRADVPHIDEPCGWPDLLALVAAEPERLSLLLDPAETALRLGAAARGAARLLLAVGPEGGFSGEEVERAVASGFLRAGLGPLVLRTETAGLAALAVVLHVHGALG